MKLLLLFIVAMSAYSANCALTDAEVTQKFNEFKTKYGKTYADANEENFRKQLFAKNLEKIEEHNKKYEQGQVTYTMGVNQFSDLTPEEMRPYTHGVLRPKNLLNKAIANKYKCVVYLSIGDKNISTCLYNQSYRKVVNSCKASAWECFKYRIYLQDAFQQESVFLKDARCEHVRKSNTSKAPINQVRATMSAELTEEFIEEKWNEFKAKYRKNYTDAEEESYRKSLFVANLQMVESHNEKYEDGLVNYKMGINQFADYSKEEMPCRHSK
nr:PREDICTED: uncharacterized protein LOC103313498 [Tribolium castaneum]|eukprot:XP_015836649.1 PREDICTED: uncharacterized protein LOC103313498 [Tribolium castaneum]